MKKVMKLEKILKEGYVKISDGRRSLSLSIEIPKQSEKTENNESYRRNVTYHETGRG